MTVGKSLLAGLALGALAALFVCHVALADNNQGEFADTVTGVYTSNLYTLFAVTTAIIGGLVALFLGLIGYLGRADD